jgi:ferredoxin-NADP reductase
MENPYRGANPFFEYPELDLLGKILIGRKLLYCYYTILAAVVVAAGIRHWWPQRSGGNDDETQLLIRGKRRRRRDRIWGFLKSQPDGEDAQEWGLMLFISGYVVLTIFFSMYNAMIHPIVLAFRLGLMSAFNLTLLYVLGMKHCILSTITGWSYEQLNILHRWVGGYAVVAATMHSAIFLYYWRWDYISENRWTIMGLFSGGAFLVIGLTSFKTVRIKLYELFYVVHLILSVACIPGVYFHYPTGRPYAVLAGAAFVYDRIYRLLVDYRLVVCDVRLSAGETVLLRIRQNDKRGWFLRRPFAWRPGQHVFLTMLTVRPLESHPFTIASTMAASGHGQGTMDIIVRAREGFSKSLYNSIQQSGVAQLRALVHGPYGTMSVPKNAGDRRRVILIAGGAGIAFTYPLLEHCKQQNAAARSAGLQEPFQVKCLWVIPFKDFQDWLDGPVDGMDIWITRQQGRPDIPALLETYLDETTMAGHGGAWIGTCGPDALIRSIRNTVASRHANGHHNLELHIEEFGW